ncbi:sensor histidine kinase [Nocardia sp. NPDC003345]
MTRWTSWWHELPGAAKFRLYTRVTLQVSLIAMGVVMAFAARSLWPSLAIVAAIAAAVAAIETRPELGGSKALVTRRWVLPAATLTLAAVALAATVTARTATDDAVVRQAAVVGVLAVLLATFAVVSFAPGRWWILLGTAVCAGLAFGTSPAMVLGIGAIVFVGGLLAIATALVTVWGLRIVDELERTKLVEAELRVAQERLRFARDLHDVVGRGFSAIAVKSELATALSRAGESGRAATEMDEVRTLAVESMGQMRELVRGYRGIDLLGEVAGARSLLSAAGCRMLVEGDAAAVPARFHEVAAWVVREGTTNIVEHSAATIATLALGHAGMSLRNDNPHRPMGERSGLRGLAERLATVGATLEAAATESEFLLEIHWGEQ